MEKDWNALTRTNIIGNIHLYNLFLPLILKGQAKKVIFISSSFSDLGFCTQNEIELAPLYTMSKAAFNMAVGKFSAQYKKDGVLFITVCPGVIEPGDNLDYSTRMSSILTPKSCIIPV